MYGALCGALFFLSRNIPSGYGPTKSGSIPYSPFIKIAATSNSRCTSAAPSTNRENRPKATNTKTGDAEPSFGSPPMACLSNIHMTYSHLCCGKSVCRLPAELQTDFLGVNSRQERNYEPIQLV